MNLTKAQASTIAYEWHGGQASPLYSFASTGCVVHSDGHLQDLKSEIRDCLYYCDSSGDSKEKHRLERLLQFIQAQPIGGPKE